MPVLAFVVSGADAGGVPEVKVFDRRTGAIKHDILAFSAAFRGGVRVAIGDVNGDSIPDIVAGAGPGGGPQVRVFDGRTGQPLPGPLGSFYGILPGNFAGGVYVAVGDVNGDGFGDVIVGADAGGGPQINVFSGKDGALLFGLNAFAAGFTGGVRVAAGDVNGDGLADVIAGAGPGAGPQVTVFSGADRTILQSFYGLPPGFTGGVFVAAGDVTGDKRAEVIVGAGTGGGPQVAIYNGTTGALMRSFFAFAPGFSGGARVGAVDINADGRADVLVSAGPGGGPLLGIFDGLTLTALDLFFAYDPSFHGGAFASGS